MSVIKSIKNRERSNVDDMGLIVTVCMIVIALAWTFS